MRKFAQFIAFLVLMGLSVGCKPALTEPTLPASPTLLPPSATPFPPTDTPSPTETPPQPRATETPPPSETQPPSATPTKPTPTPDPVVVEEISFQFDQFNLVGDLQIPDAEGVYPTVIMVHGSGNSDRTDWGKYRPIMRRFLGAGYAVFCWDNPGVGESTGQLSYYADVLSQRAGILLEAIKLLKEHPSIDPLHIGVWGISQGGYVIPLAATMSDDIAFMITISGPAMDSYDQGAFLGGQKAFCAGASQEEADQIEEYLSSAQKATTYQEYFDNTTLLLEHSKFRYLEISISLHSESSWEPEDPGGLAFFNPIDAIDDLTIPVLAVFGEKDRQVDPFQGAEAYLLAFEKTGVVYSQVALFPGADHNIVLSETGCLDERANRPSADWLKYAPGYLDLLENWVLHLFEDSE